MPLLGDFARVVAGSPARWGGLSLQNKTLAVLGEMLAIEIFDASDRFRLSHRVHREYRLKTWCWLQDEFSASILCCRS